MQEAAGKALDGTADDVRRFLETGQYEARFQDDRVRVAQIMSVGGPTVKERGRAVLQANTEQAVQAFLETGQHDARLVDDRIRATRIAEAGGPAVKAAARKA
ncbi:ALF repeat-containing protein [Streptomyces gobitricini]|uniref:Uncharacterized protein n=1 Tax=Streptomyces gobitricini TaxID=68211 RepID=A0ABN3NCJ5_9ACTN